MSAALITASLVSEYLEEVGRDLTCSREQIERLLMQVFAMRPNDVFRMLGEIDQRVNELSAAFGIDVGHAPELETVLTEAQRLLAEIALASQLRLVNAHVSIGRAERIRIAAEEQVESLQDSAWRDHLTGAFNRAWLEQALGNTLRQAQQRISFAGIDVYRY